MKKNTFIEGAFIATIGIVIVKVIGLLYVIPFNAIIGERGGALYGYAYNIYQLFLAVSSAGFPFAISKLTSEYLAKDNQEYVRRTYDVAIKLILIISVFVFLVLFCFAPEIAKLIIGETTGGNTQQDIAAVIRCVSFAILIVPFLGVTKGFLQGNKYIGPTSMSQVIEQVVRVAIILIGSFIIVKVLKMNTNIAVNLAVSGAFFGGLCGYLYLRYKIKKSGLLTKNQIIKKDKKATKIIIKKIIDYSIPFIIISVIYTLYNTVDMILVSRTMGDILKMSGDKVESVISVFTTWGVKLNSILLAVTTGLTTSLIPNIVDSFVKGNKKDVDLKFNKALQCMLLIIVPASIFLSLLVKPVWTLFYGKSYYGPLVYKMFVYAGLFGGLHSVVVSTLQGLNKYKLVITCVLIGLLLNTFLDIPFMLLMNKIGVETSYGAVIAAVFGYSVSMILSLMVLNKKYHFSFKDTINRMPSYILSWGIFIGVILLLKLFIPVNLTNRLIQIPILALYGLFSFGIYFVVNYLFGNLKILKDIRKRG